MDPQYEEIDVKKANSLIPYGEDGIIRWEEVCTPQELSILREVKGDFAKLRGRTDPEAMNLKQLGATVAVMVSLHSRGLVSSVRSDWYYPQEGPIVADLGYLHCRMGSEWGLCDPLVKLRGLDAYLSERNGAVLPGERIVEGSSANAFLPLANIEHVNHLVGTPFDEHFLLMWNGEKFVECGYSLRFGFLPIIDGRVFAKEELLINNDIETWNRFYGIRYNVIGDSLQLSTWGPTDIAAELPRSLEEQIVKYLRGQVEREDFVYPEEGGSALVTFDSVSYSGRVHGHHPLKRDVSPEECSSGSHLEELGHAVMLNEIAASLRQEQHKSKAIIVGQIVGDSCRFILPFVRAYQPVPKPPKPEGLSDKLRSIAEHFKNSVLPGDAQS